MVQVKEDFDQKVQFTHTGTETTQATFIYTLIFFSQLERFYIHFLILILTTTLPGRHHAWSALQSQRNPVLNDKRRELTLNSEHYT